MAKKKKSHKKVHRHSSKARSRSQSTSASAVQSAAATTVPLPTATTALDGSHPASAVSAAAAVPAGRWAYVGNDLKRVGLLAAACIVIEAVAWFLFNHTGVGTAIYSHISL